METNNIGSFCTNNIVKNSNTILSNINSATGNLIVKRLCKLQSNTENATTLLRVDAPTVTKQQVINQFNTYGYEKCFGTKGVYKEIKFITSDGIVKFDYQNLIN